MFHCFQFCPTAVNFVPETGKGILAQLSDRTFDYSHCGTNFCQKIFFPDWKGSDTDRNKGPLTKCCSFFRSLHCTLSTCEWNRLFSFRYYHNGFLWLVHKRLSNRSSSQFLSRRLKQLPRSSRIKLSLQKLNNQRAGAGRNANNHTDSHQPPTTAAIGTMDVLENSRKSQKPKHSSLVVPTKLTTRQAETKNEPLLLENF